MNIEILPIEQFHIFLICFSRVLALVSAMPVIVGAQATTNGKIAISVMTTLVMFPLLAPYTPPISFNVTELAFLFLGEVLLGYMLGQVTQFIFSGVTFAGSIIGYQMGFAAANIFDPQTTQQLSLIAQFQNILTILIFLALDVHHIFFLVIRESYQMIPPGSLDFTGDTVLYLVDLSSKLFVLGLKLCAPILSLLLISNMVLGVLSRVFPQLNVFMLSFPVNIAISFIVMNLTLHLFAYLLKQEFDTLPFIFMNIFSSL